MIIIGSQLENIRTLKDKSMKLTFETGELNPQELLGIMENLGEFGYLAFKQEPFKKEEKEIIENLETGYDDKGKSPSQRLRGVLYVLYTKDKEGFDTFTRFYEHHLEKITNHYKSKLD